MDKRTYKQTLKQIFEFTDDDVTEPYEVVRTIGFTLNCKSGSKVFRLEAIKRPGEKLASVLVWERKKDGAWERNTFCEQPTLHRVHPDLALQSMVSFMQQHLPHY